MKFDTARDVALNILKEVNHDGKYANISLKRHLRQSKLSSIDTSFVTQLVYGTLEKQITIDWIMGEFASFKRANPWILNIVRMGCYQIMYLDKVPNAAACNEAVELTKKYVSNKMSAFVNGVLRNISRNKEKIVFPPIENDPALYFSLLYSYPKWLCEKWIEQYGIKFIKQFFASDTLKKYTTIRINAIKANKVQAEDYLNKYGSTILKGLYTTDTFRIVDIKDIENNEMYRQGLLTIQGEASILAVQALDPSEDDFIIDACSAPGGKACYIAEKMNLKGQIAAWDIHKHRVELIQMNAIRLGADSIVKANIQDSTVFLPHLDKKADRVLVDAPCSGLGVAYKKPDIKLKIEPKNINELPKIQKSILSTCAKYVKPGGILVYSTCTINKDENEMVVYDFLKNNQDFELDDISPYIPTALRENIFSKGMIQLLPGRDKIDGFFISRMKRKVQ